MVCNHACYYVLLKHMHSYTLWIQLVKPRKLNILQEVGIAMTSLANAFITMGLFNCIYQIIKSTYNGEQIIENWNLVEKITCSKG